MRGIIFISSVKGSTNKGMNLLLFWCVCVCGGGGGGGGGEGGERGRGGFFIFRVNSY